MREMDNIFIPVFSLLIIYYTVEFTCISSYFFHFIQIHVVTKRKFGCFFYFYIFASKFDNVLYVIRNKCA